ncbi:MAG: Tol-Pal system beta propeller repeat protein TolB [Deltaproteobacteria bacterium RBG_13_65_10]|nr:MAG: Tol-Pal system beta propeller repeat protein TolB [Deltaproteobacteria bacterium RBG_13_65_10]
MTHTGRRPSVPSPCTHVAFALAVLLSCFLPGLPIDAHAQGRTLVVTPFERKFKIAIQPLVGDTADAMALGKQIADVVSRDLDFTGIFQPLNPASFLEDPRQVENVDFQTWRSIGAEALVKGSVVDTDGRIAVEARIFDVYKGQRVVGKRYSGDARDWRQIAHKLANEIFKYFTGDDGVFDSQIAFAGKPTRGAKEIFVADFDGSNVTQVTRNASINNFPKWSRDGSRLCFTSFKRGHPTLYLIGRGMRGARALRPSSVIYQGSWSPKGDLLAVAGLVGGNSEILLLSSGGLSFTRLTSHPAIDTAPTWSPDGSKILFVSDRSGSPQIYVMNADGSGQHRLSFQGSYNVHPVWSPKGDRIVYAGMVGGRFDIFTMKPDGSNVVQLTSSGNNEYPSWAPNGRQITFQSGRGARTGIYVINANGTNLRRIASAPEGATAPDWSGHIP